MRIPPADRLFAVVGYLPFLFWVPVVFRRQSMFCQFHGRQSGVLWGMWLVLALACVVPVLWLAGDAILWFFGAAAVVTILYLLMALTGMLKSLLRERYRMPVVADVALILRL